MKRAVGAAARSGAARVVCSPVLYVGACRFRAGMPTMPMFAPTLCALAADTRTPTMYLEFKLKPGALLTQAIPPGYNAFICACGCAICSRTVLRTTRGDVLLVPAPVSAASRCGCAGIWPRAHVTTTSALISPLLTHLCRHDRGDGNVRPGARARGNCERICRFRGGDGQRD